MKYAPDRDVRFFHDNETGRDCTQEGVVPTIPATTSPQPLSRLELSPLEEQNRTDAGAVALVVAVITLGGVVAAGVFWFIWWLFHRG